MNSFTFSCEGPIVRELSASAEPECETDEQVITKISLSKLKSAIIESDEEWQYTGLISCRVLYFLREELEDCAPGTYTAINPGPEHCMCQGDSYSSKRMFYFVDDDNEIRLAVIKY